MQRQIKYHFFECVESTQLEAKKMVKEKNTLTCVAAFSQTAGKGTFGKTWISPKDSGLYVTFCFHTNSLQYANALSLMGSCAACLLCDSINPNLKWPNDIQIEGKKLGGVITEISDGYVYVGIGINIKKTQGLQDKVDQPITCFEDFRKAGDLFEMIKELANHFNHLLVLWEKEGFKGFKSIYEKYFKLINKPVVVELRDGLKKGQLMGFSDVGCPILKEALHEEELFNVLHITQEKS
jgi:BirA family biotin operon repressor/biotin-[acetyl-CoA-carboxylase] ligase